MTRCPVCQLDYSKLRRQIEQPCGHSCCCYCLSHKCVECEAYTVDSSCLSGFVVEENCSDDEFEIINDQPEAVSPGLFVSSGSTSSANTTSSKKSTSSAYLPTKSSQQRAVSKRSSADQFQSTMTKSSKKSTAAGSEKLFVSKALVTHSRNSARECTFPFNKTTSTSPASVKSFKKPSSPSSKPSADPFPLKKPSFSPASGDRQQKNNSQNPALKRCESLEVPVEAVEPVLLKKESVSVEDSNRDFFPSRSSYVVPIELPIPSQIPVDTNPNSSHYYLHINLHLTTGPEGLQISTQPPTRTTEPATTAANPLEKRSESSPPEEPEPVGRRLQFFPTCRSEKWGQVEALPPRFSPEEHPLSEIVEKYEKLFLSDPKLDMTKT